MFGADVETQDTRRVDHKWDDRQQNHRGNKQRRERIPPGPARVPDQDGRQDDADAPQRVLAIVSPAKSTINRSTDSHYVQEDAAHVVRVSMRVAVAEAVMVVIVIVVMVVVIM